MPVYEYECEAKHGVIEVQQSIKDDPLTLCPECKKENVESPVKKLISATNFQLQGGGWAANGYSK